MCPDNISMHLEDRFVVARAQTNEDSHPFGSGVNQVIPKGASDALAFPGNVPECFVCSDMDPRVRHDGLLGKQSRS